MAQHKRSYSRMQALQALCCLDASDGDFIGQLDSFLRDTTMQRELGAKPPLDPAAISFARELATEAWRRHAEYDALLASSVSGWPVHRMSPVDRNVLRLGLHELTHHAETPHQVVINEAIELARRFGDADSPSFVNGVLDAIRREQGLTPPTAADLAPAAPPTLEPTTGATRVEGEDA